MTTSQITHRAKVLAAYNTADTLRQRLAAMQRVQHAPADAAVLREAIATVRQGGRHVEVSA